MTNTTRWGILGSGSIAKQFARGLADTPNAVLQSVGSRAQKSADAFADQFDIPTRHASYEALANDPEIDAIYVSTPHPFHKDNSILCLEAGKAVICEKPFAINAAEAEAVVQVARDQGVFLMEAMWSRYFPAMVKVKEWLDEGAIGDVRIVSADFGFRTGINPEGRLFNPALGGGALLDVGIYVTSFASFVLGPNPTRIQSLANIGETGVDE
ncbi:MAG: dihydrodiol dehydrogenase / D-xylose 1-dehydrogenase (NADP), partial [Candidatus Latescibacterota bacterium]